MTKRMVSNWTVFSSSLFPKPIPPNALALPMQSLLSRHSRIFLKLIGLPIARLLELYSPVILKEIVLELSMKPPLTPLKGHVMGYECSLGLLIALYTGVLGSSKVLAKSIQYLIDSDAERVIGLRLAEYLEACKDDEVSADEVKGISDAIRYGSKAVFELWTSVCEYIIVMVLFEHFYNDQFSQPFFVVSAVSSILCALDIFSHSLLAIPLKIAGERLMQASPPVEDYATTTTPVLAEITDLEKTQRRRWRRGCFFSVWQEIILAVGLFWVMRIVSDEVKNPASSCNVADFIVVFFFYLSLASPHSKINASAGPLTMYVPYLRAQTARLNRSGNWGSPIILPALRKPNINPQLKDFIYFLSIHKQTPITFYLHYPIDDPNQFYRDLAKAGDVDQFCNRYLTTIKKGALASIWILSVGSFAWQAAANLSDMDDLAAFSINTGFWAAVGISMASCTVVEKSAAAYLVVVSSKLLPIWLADSLWQMISLSTQNPGKHLVYFIGEGGLYTVAQLLMSKGVKAALIYYEAKQKISAYVPRPTWSTPGLISVCYFGFQYLTGPLSFLTSLFAAFFSVAISAATWGVVVDLAIAHRNIAALKNLSQKHAITYSQGNYTYESLDEPFENKPLASKRTFCQTFTNCLTAPFRCCYSLLWPRSRNRTEVSLLQSSVNSATMDL